jgi:AcrR family transcriptional regulator
MDELARALECAKGTIYLHFENKDHILTYLISQGLEKLCADIENQCIRNPDLMSAINNYLELQYHFFREFNQILSSWGRRRMQNHIKEEWIEDINHKLDQKLEMAATVFERGKNENALFEADSSELAVILESIFQNATFPYLEHKPLNDDPAKVLSLMKIILTHGIMLNKASPSEYEDINDSYKDS